MFGEYALYVDEKVVAFVCDNSVFLKPCVPTKALTEGFPVAPPYPGAKDYSVIDEFLDEPHRLQQLLLVTASALPKSKPKKQKVKKRWVELLRVMRDYFFRVQVFLSKLNTR